MTGRDSSDFEELRRRVVGHRLPGGSFRVEDYERFLSHDAMGSPALPAGLLHPSWILLGGLRGMGMTMEEVSELVGATERDVVMFGETALDQRVPLCAGVSYRVTGRIAGLRESRGRRGGVMHVYDLELTVADPDAEVCALASLTFLILKEAAHA